MICSSTSLLGPRASRPHLIIARRARRVEALKARNVIAQGNALGKVNTQPFADPRWVGVADLTIHQSVDALCTRYSMRAGRPRSQ
jgi:hypothetical protein